ncbi:hypothetical protein HWC35_gp028 [Vibrio phage USC-1]|uniref:HTH araC/xylS-type domain-containing protein n=2 Tax=Aphroditevirus USC1 TaxID=2846605 RepID=A0A514A2H6_9CAUD|nr:hypothetical protein HWC35_gp028 [Vibrio phage USC-1]QCW23094.1 hypothetical protein [Vibrio phage 5 TSL-2019]QDH47422.1 hypothetical protein [Vibrio phage USC-1]
MKQNKEENLRFLSNEEKELWVKIKQEVKGKLFRMTLKHLVKHLGEPERTISKLISSVTDLAPAEWFSEQRKLSIINELKDPSFDVSTLQAQMGFKYKHSFFDYFRDKFEFSFPEIEYLHSLGLSKDYLESEFDNVDEYIAFEMIRIIQRAKGKVKVKEDLLDFFKCSHTWFYRIWYAHNGPETPYEFISFTRISCIRKDFLESKMTPKEYFLKNNLPSHNVDYIHKVHYGITFRSWAGKQVKGVPRRRKNGYDELLGEEWLDVIKQHITDWEIRIETIAKVIGLPPQAIRNIITYYRKQTYLEYKYEVLNSKQSNLTVESYV